MLDGGGWSMPRPGKLIPGEETWYTLYKRLDGPLGQSARVQKISPPLAFALWTIQPVASRYTDYVIQVHILQQGWWNFLMAHAKLPINSGEIFTRLRENFEVQSKVWTLVSSVKFIIIVIYHIRSLTYIMIVLLYSILWEKNLSNMLYSGRRLTQ